MSALAPRAAARKADARAGFEADRAELVRELDRLLRARDLWADEEAAREGERLVRRLVELDRIVEKFG